MLANFHRCGSHFHIRTCVECSRCEPPGAITYVGTDSNIYYCDAKCAQPKCITCKAAAIHVRRDDAIMPVTLADDVPDAGPACRRH